MNFLVMPIFFLSGALFPLDNLPKTLVIISHLNPLSYGVDGVRSALTGVTHFSFATNFSVLGLSIIILLIIGSWLFSKIEA
jgi:ABC-2 type transport system permease protein